MKNDNQSNDLLLRALEQLGQCLAENTPEALRLNIETIDVLVGVNRASHLDMAELRERCPTFVSVYRDVMLREIEEPIPNGDDT